MIKFTLRVEDDELVRRFDELAKKSGRTRTAYLVDLMEQIVDRDYIPERDGEGFRASTDTGGEVTLIRHDRYVSAGMSGLTTAQESAYEQAWDLAKPENGSQWQKARRTLENAGFNVYRLSPIVALPT